jgi:hypothetical protein
MKISQTDLDTLMIGATRYALGRQSYIVSEQCNLIRRYWDRMSQNTRDVIKHDIESAIANAENMGRTLGMKQDHRNWRSLLAELEDYYDA